MARRMITMLLLAVVVAACASDADDAMEMDVDEAHATIEDGVPEVAGDADTPDGGEPPTDSDDAAQPGEVPRPVSEALGRRVIRTASIELEVADPSEAADEVTRIAERAGGFVATADLRRDAEGVLHGTVTLRVPSSELLATLDELDALAESASPRRIDERDVTVESADLEAQLTNLTTFERELRALLADVRQTTDRPEDLLTVFERVREVRAEIDVIQNRLAVLDDQVALSTITATITPAPAAVPVTDPTWQPAVTAREALTATARALAGLADAAIWFVLGVAPVLAVFAVPLGIAGTVWWRRRQGAPVDAPSSPPSAPPPAATAG